METASIQIVPILELTVKSDCVLWRAENVDSGIRQAINGYRKTLFNQPVV